MSLKEASNLGFGVAISLILAGLPLSWTGSQIELGYSFLGLAILVAILSLGGLFFDKFWRIEMAEEKPKSVSGGNVGLNSGTIHYHAPVSYVATTPNNTVPLRDPDGIYQHGEIVATVQGANVHVAYGTITFQTIRSVTGKANPEVECEYRDWVIKCSDLPRPPPNANVGMFVGMVSGGSAKIIRKRA